MKGFLTSNYPSPVGEYSDLKVMESAAGWYIGTTFHHTSGDYAGLVEPGSRESGYYRSKVEAELALQTLTWTQRLHP